MSLGSYDLRRTHRRLILKAVHGLGLAHLHLLSGRDTLLDEVHIWRVRLRSLKIVLRQLLHDLLPILLLASEPILVALIVI
jgi:hypothetical protein